LTASFIMVMWDVCMDPYMATILKNWIWIRGGSFYGVPFKNFLGRYLCVYTFYQIFAIYLCKKI
jgi:putative membrane protein